MPKLIFPIQFNVFPGNEKIVKKQEPLPNLPDPNLWSVTVSTLALKKNSDSG